MSWLLVVQVIRGKHFRHAHPFTDVYVSARFNGSTQQTDGVASSNSPVWSTDLVWEMNDEELKKLKSSQSVRIEAWAATGDNNRRKKMGYLIIPFRQIRVKDTQCAWVRLLSAPLGVPEIKLRTRVVSSEEYYAEVDALEERGSAVTPLQQQAQLASPRHVSPFPQQQRLTLLNDPQHSTIIREFNLLSPTPKKSVIHSLPPAQEEKVYPSMFQLGEADDSDMEFKVSVSVEAVRHLQPLLGNAPRDVYVFYELFDVRYSSTVFRGTEMPASLAEKKTYYVRSSAESALAYFGDQAISFYVCVGESAMGVVDVEIARLLDNWLSHDCDVAQALEESFPVKRMPNVAAVVGAPAEGAAPMMRIMVELELLAGSKKPVMSPMTLPTSPILSISHGASAIFSPNNAEKLNFTVSSPLPQQQPPQQLLEEAEPHVRPAYSDAGVSVVKKFRITIDITGLKALDPSHVLNTHDVTGYLSSQPLDVGLYCRYEYPLLFGTTHIFSDLAMYVESGEIVAEPQMGGGAYSFEFAMDEKNLAVALQETCLGVEVWRTREPQRHDSTGLPLKRMSTSKGDYFIGMAQVPLANLLGDGHTDTREMDASGRATFKVEEFFPVLPEMPREDQAHRRPRVGFVKATITLLEQGNLDEINAVTEQEVQALYEYVGQLEEMLRTKKRECSRLQKKFDTAQFEADIAEHQDQEMMTRVKENYEKMLYGIVQKYDSDLDKQKTIAQQALATTTEYHKRVSLLEKENESLRSKLLMMSSTPEKTPAKQLRARDKENEEKIVNTPPSAKRKVVRSASVQQMRTGIKL